MDLKTITKFIFFDLAIASGILLKLCSEEVVDRKSMCSPLWFMDGNKFSGKGDKYRKLFLLVSSLAMIDIIVWASL